jgi:DNA-binding NarL/FixJ family response regulator
MTTTVLVAVRSPEIREGLVAMLSALEGFQVVGEAASGEQALELARSVRPRLALVDEGLAGECEWPTVHAMHTEGLAEVIVALGRRAQCVQAQLAGARTYVQMGTAPRELLSVLEAAIHA